MMHAEQARHLVAAAAARPHRLAVVPSAEQLLIGPEVDQVRQAVAALRAHKAGGVPQGVMVTCALCVNNRTVL